MRPELRATLPRWLPFAVYALVLAGAIVALDRLGVVLFSAVWPFALLAVLPWVWWVHLRGKPNIGRGRGVLVAFTRMFMITLLVAALADPRAVREDRRMSVVFAIDHSASIQADATDAAIGYVLRVVADKPEADEAGLVFFGRNAGVELPPGVSLPFESINVDVDREGTDIAEALSLSAALLPADRRGRIVLIGDGVETEGQLAPVLDDLRSRDIAVDVVPIDYAAENEVWLEKLELPWTVKLGDTIEPAVVLSALTDGQGMLTLEDNGVVVARQQIRYRAGKNRFAVPLLLDAPGFHEYLARIETGPGGDHWERNNVAMSTLFLEGKGRVLVVVGPQTDPRESAPLVAALQEQDRLVDVQRSSALARNPLRFLPYDGIVFVNAPRDAIDEMQMQAVHDAVFDQGSGFLMVGGQGSFGPGGYHRTVIEDLLPVSMDMSQRKVMPKGALAVILHTCEFPQGNTWGKRITLQAIKVLQDRDEVGVLVHGFRGGDGWLFPLTPASEYESLAPLVHNAKIGDMPGFAPTMQLAHKALTASDAATRHVIIISDGDPQPPLPQLLQQYKSAGISVSTVTVFPHDPKGGIDVRKMRNIAAVTGGRHYQPADPNTLPSIFIKEAKTLRRSAIQNTTFTPAVVDYSQVLEGIEGFPPLHGYVLTSPKPRSLVILEGPEEDEPDPVLARWNYGIGASAAFTSDLSPNWARDWMQWDRFRPFAQQLVTDILRPRRDRRLQVRSMASRGMGIVQVEDHGEDVSAVDLKAVVDGPNGSRPLRLEQVAPRRYEARFPLQGVGRYRVVVSTPGERGRRAHTGFAVPFSQEYLRFRADRLLLEHVADRTGGRVLDGREEAAGIYAPDRAPTRSSRPISDLLIALALLLLPLEVAFRRVQADRALLRRLFGRGERAGDATVGTLLAKKMEKARQERPRPAARAPAPAAERTDDERPPVRGPERPAKPARPAAEPTPAGEQSTMERLLAMKKRAQRGAENDSDPAQKGDS